MMRGLLALYGWAIIPWQIGRRTVEQGESQNNYSQVWERLQEVDSPETRVRLPAR